MACEIDERSLSGMACPYALQCGQHRALLPGHHRKGISVRSWLTIAGRKGTRGPADRTRRPLRRPDNPGDGSCRPYVLLGCPRVGDLEVPCNRTPNDYFAGEHQREKHSEVCQVMVGAATKVLENLKNGFEANRWFSVTTASSPVCVKWSKRS